MFEEQRMQDFLASVLTKEFDDKKLSELGVKNFHIFLRLTI
jgi:hypothetical protein